MAWLRLIRWKNLLIVFFTQFAVWYCLMPGNTGFAFKPFVDFLCLTLSTVLIAAAGYIINDYFDLKIDIINRPEKVVLERKIHLKSAIVAHSILNVVALIMAALVARTHYYWLLVQLVSTGLLWFYSTHFKKQFIIGNLIVALLTALTVLVMVIYWPRLVEVQAMPTEGEINPRTMCYGFALFAFLLTWMREIVKDMEDYKGDAEEGCMTLPIKMGLHSAARFAQVLGVFTILLLAVVSGIFLKDACYLLGAYTLVAILFPLIVWCFFLLRKNTTEHYGSASKWLKMIMISGICSLIVYHFFTPST